MTPPEDQTTLQSPDEETAASGTEPKSRREARQEGQPSLEDMHVPRSQRIDNADSDEQITEKLRAQGVRIGKGGISPAVFWPALLIIVAVGLLGVLAPDFTGEVFEGTQSWIVTNFGWYYMLIIGGFVAFTLILGFSRFGKIKLGRDTDKPEFGLLSWFSMLFAAGMGIGLVFYGVGEPLMYATVSQKPGFENLSESELQGMAMAQTFVHWGLHPWSVYAVVGLSIAYAVHRRGRPVSIRWALEPIFGDRVKGWIGDVIDVLAIFGTVFGVATSLGLGVQQISTGMQSMGIVGEVDNTLLVILIVCITFLALVSVLSGLGKGIRWLSNANLSLAGILLLAVLLLGPTVFLFQNFVQSLGVYLANFMNMTFDAGAYTNSEEATSWYSSWTLFYWGWWIAWSPFVGVFIARISRGRTVRQFIAGVLLVPTLVGFLWFSIMGGSGLHRQFFGEGDLVQDGSVGAEAALFQVLSGLPLGEILSVAAIILVAIFFITSSDSGSLVVDMLASGGHPNPPAWSRTLWSLVEGLLAIGLLLAGGLTALQAGSLITALPFSVIMLLMCVATLRALSKDVRERDALDRELAIQHVRKGVSNDIAGEITHSPEFEEYVDNRIDYRISRTKGIFSQDRDR